MADDTNKPAEATAPVPVKAAPAATRPKAAAPRRTARPAKAAAAKPAAKPAARKPAAAKPAAAKKAARPAKPVVAKKAAKPVKPKKVKLVRDSFTMPETEYALIAELKKRCLGMGVSAKKSEILRAAVAGLARLGDAAVAAAIGRLDVIKTGRPAKSGK
ncbi:MAG: hypothetical protein ABIK08_02410 [Pseudomonadota bacterium]